jgi:hypothetical protein
MYESSRMRSAGKAFVVNCSPSATGKMTKPKKMIGARQVLEDISNGLDDDALMVKYALSFRQLQRLYRKMILGGYITPNALAGRLCVTTSQVKEAMARKTKSGRRETTETDSQSKK